MRFGKAFSMTVLAFNNAGFIGLHGVEEGAALEPDPASLTAASVLVVLGAVGCLVILDAGRKRRWSTLSLNTKIVVATTGLVALFGTVALLLLGIRESRYDRRPAPGRQGVHVRVRGYRRPNIRAHYRRLFTDRRAHESVDDGAYACGRRVGIGGWGNQDQHRGRC